MVMAAEPQHFSRDVDRDFVAVEVIRARTCAAGPHDKAGISSGISRQEKLDADFAGCDWNRIAQQLGTGTGVAVNRTVGRDFPRAVESDHSLHGLRYRRLLEAFAEDHLAVDAAVDFVVYVLDARSGEIAADLVPGLAEVDVDLGFLGGGAREANELSQCDQ